MAQSLLAKTKENSEDADMYWTLVRHYEYKGNVRDLDALRLGYIEHNPDLLPAIFLMPKGVEHA